MTTIIIHLKPSHPNIKSTPEFLVNRLLAKYGEQLISMFLNAVNRTPEEERTYFIEIEEDDMVDKVLMELKNSKLVESAYIEPELRIPTEEESEAILKGSISSNDLPKASWN